MRKNKRAATLLVVALLAIMIFLGVLLVCSIYDLACSGKSESVSTEIEDTEMPEFYEWAQPTQEPESTDPELQESEPKKEYDSFDAIVDHNPSVPEGLTREEQAMWHLDRAMELLAEEYGFDYDAPSRQQSNGPFEASE